MQVSKKETRQMIWGIADAVSYADIDQVEREKLAEAVADAIPFNVYGVRRESFVVIASDPLCLCAGYGDNPCPAELKIRVRMHFSGDPDGRSEAWEPTKPVVRCVSCGSKHFRRAA